MRSKRTNHMVSGILLFMVFAIAFVSNASSEEIPEDYIKQYVEDLSNVALNKPIELVGEDLSGTPSALVDDNCIVPEDPYYFEQTNSVAFHEYHNEFPENLSQYIAVHLNGVFVIDMITVCSTPEAAYDWAYWDLVHNEWRLVQGSYSSGYDSFDGIPDPDYPLQPVKTPLGPRIATNAIAIFPYEEGSCYPCFAVTEIVVMGKPVEFLTGDFDGDGVPFASDRCYSTEEGSCVDNQGCPTGGQYTQEDLDNAVATAVAELQKKVEVLTTENERLQGQVAELSAAIEKKNQEIETLKGTIVKKDREIAELETQIRQLNGQITQHEQIIADLYNKLNDLNAWLKQQEKTIADLNNQITELKNQITQNEKTINDLKYSLDQGALGLAEIQNLLGTPPGRRTSNTSYSGKLGSSLNASIQMLLAPPGNNISGNTQQGKKAK